MIKDPSKDHDKREQENEDWIKERMPDEKESDAETENYNIDGVCWIDENFNENETEFKFDENFGVNIKE